MAVALDRVAVRIAAVALHPHGVDPTVVPELRPPPAVVFAVEPGFAIVARKTIVDAFEVCDVVAGQGQADQRQTRPSRRVAGPVVRRQGRHQPDHGQHCHEAPLPTDSLPAHLVPVRSARMTARVRQCRAKALRLERLCLWRVYICSRRTVSGAPKKMFRRNACRSTPSCTTCGLQPRAGACRPPWARGTRRLRTETRVWSCRACLQGISLTVHGPLY